MIRNYEEEKNKKKRPRGEKKKKKKKEKPSAVAAIRHRPTDRPTLSAHCTRDLAGPDGTAPTGWRQQIKRRKEKIWWQAVGRRKKKKKKARRRNGRREAPTVFGRSSIVRVDSIKHHLCAHHLPTRTTHMRGCSSVRSIFFYRGPTIGQIVLLLLLLLLLLLYAAQSWAASFLSRWTRNENSTTQKGGEEENAFGLRDCSRRVRLNVATEQTTITTTLKTTTRNQTICLYKK